MLSCSNNSEGLFVFGSIWHNKKKHLSFALPFWNYRMSFFDGLYFLANRISLVFILALVIQTLGFVEILIAFKVHSLKGSCKYSAPLMWSKVVYNKSAPLQICSLFAYLLLCMGGKHGRKKNSMHKHVNIVCHLVVRRQSKRVVCHWSVTMVIIHRCQWHDGPIPG